MEETGSPDRLESSGEEVKRKKKNKKKNQKKKKCKPEEVEKEEGQGGGRVLSAEEMLQSTLSAGTMAALQVINEDIRESQSKEEKREKENEGMRKKRIDLQGRVRKRIEGKGEV